MPHVLIKMLPGRSAAQKADIAAKVTRAVMDGAKCGENAVSISIEDVPSEDWTETVHKTDIMDRPDTLFKARLQPALGQYRPYQRAYTNGRSS